MDNKITKKRLGGFLAYEWIAIILVAALITLGVGLIYIMTGVRPSSGQEFYFFFDQAIVGNSNGLKNLITLSPPNNTFSYEMLEVYGESLSSNYNLLTTRLAALQGDAIFTDTTIIDSGEYSRYCRANALIDGTATPIFSYEDLLLSANKYLEKFYDGEDLNRDKVKDYFLTRMKNDNRFKSEKEKAEGVEKEIERIAKIKVCANLLDKLLAYDDMQEKENKIFYSYIRYEQSYYVTTGSEKEEFRIKYEEEKAQRGERRYGLKMDKLDGNEYQVRDYFVNSNGKTENIILCLFDLTQKSDDRSIYDLQFESLSFFDTVIRDFSTLGRVV